MTPRFLDAGECALSVEFGDRIEDAITAQVTALDAALAAEPVAGVVETVPTYRALLVEYDPLLLPRAALVAHLRGLLARPAAPVARGRLWRLPACYELQQDLDHVAQACGLPPARVVDLHAGAAYRVAMYGFSPGWAYLSGLPAALALPRRATPRDRIPAGSLIIAGGLAIVAALPMPSGWHILGRTPVRLFDPARDPAFLVAPGDRIAFDRIDRATFDALEARAAAGDPLVAP
jgi:KipI family sensor histidine kinase inhibitor